VLLNAGRFLLPSSLLNEPASPSVMRSDNHDRRLLLLLELLSNSVAWTGCSSGAIEKRGGNETSRRSFRLSVLALSPSSVRVQTNLLKVDSRAYAILAVTDPKILIRCCFVQQSKRHKHATTKETSRSPYPQWCCPLSLHGRAVAPPTRGAASNAESRPRAVGVVLAVVGLLSWVGQNERR
jgi:hypothetical protein